MQCVWMITVMFARRWKWRVDTSRNGSYYDTDKTEACILIVLSTGNIMFLRVGSPRLKKLHAQTKCSLPITT